MLRTVLIAVVFAAFMSGGQASEQEKTVQELLSACKCALSPFSAHCRTGFNSQYALYCLGLANDVMNTLIQSNAENNARVRACITRFTSNAQVVQTFINWAERNPQHWQANAGDGMIVATMETWPCE